MDLSIRLFGPELFFSEIEKFFMSLRERSYEDIRNLFSQNSMFGLRVYSGRDCSWSKERFNIISFDDSELLKLRFFEKPVPVSREIGKKK